MGGETSSHKKVQLALGKMSVSTMDDKSSALVLAFLLCPWSATQSIPTKMIYPLKSDSALPLGK